MKDFRVPSETPYDLFQMGYEDVQNKEQNLCS